MKRLLLVYTLFLLTESVFAAVRWSPRSFPAPETHPDECNASKSRRLCDPDGMLTFEDKQSLIDAIQVFEDSHSILCGKEQKEEDIQLAMVLVNQMDLREFRNYQEPEERAAKNFATFLHNTWGVGVDSSCGGTGILVFLSMHDRAIYISVGQALKATVLTDYRLDQVILEMKPLLRRVQYGKALETAIHEIARHVQSGEPSRMERLWALLVNIWPFCFFASVVGLVAIQGCLQQRRQREYARVQTQLSELDRNRAEALQGRYQCTSCPICLNDFEPSAEDGEAPKIGSDGLPLKLLRCGHVFDQTCWDEWIETGQGNFRQCPICKEDIGMATEEQVVTGAEQQQGTGEDAIRQRGGGGGALQEQGPRAMRRYNEERMFRLARLSVQFPRFVNRNQVQRWSDPSYDRSLARDTSFTRSNPVHPRYSSSGNSGFHRSSRGFGGGRSCGGRSGRW